MRQSYWIVSNQHLRSALICRRGSWVPKQQYPTSLLCHMHACGRSHMSSVHCSENDLPWSDVMPHLTVNILHRVPVCIIHTVQCTVQAVCAPVAMHALLMCVPQHPACLPLSPIAIECDTLLSFILFIWQAFNLEGPSTHNTAEVLSGRPEHMLARVSIQNLQQ